jgi:hypothetical protein
MAYRRFKPIFERSLQEQSDLLQPKIDQIKQENLSRGFYNSYRNDQCVSDDLLIHEYADRTELVRVNSQTGQIHTIRRIS